MINTIKIKNRRAQVEIIGLVIIVILISLGMLFMAQFALKDQPDKKVFNKRALAYSTMSALMRTTLSEEGCALGYLGQSHPQLGADIIEDCANYIDTDYSAYNCRNKHSCVFINESVAELLNSTLGSWKVGYEFHSNLVGFMGEKELALVKSKGGCAKNKAAEASEFPIPTDNGIIRNILYICD